MYFFNNFNYIWHFLYIFYIKTDNKNIIFLIIFFRVFSRTNIAFIFAPFLPSLPLNKKQFHFISDAAIFCIIFLSGIEFVNYFENHSVKSTYWCIRIRWCVWSEAAKTKIWKCFAFPFPQRYIKKNTLVYLIARHVSPLYS